MFIKLKRKLVKEEDKDEGNAERNWKIAFGIELGTSEAARLGP